MVSNYPALPMVLVRVRPTELCADTEDVVTVIGCVTVVQSCKCRAPTYAKLNFHVAMISPEDLKGERRNGR